MATLSSIRKQIEVLEKKAQELIKKESAQAIAKVRELIEKYGLTAEDIGLMKQARTSARQASDGRAKRGSKKVGKAVGVPMYQDPETGKTWTGRGKPPTWIAGAADRSRFLIAQPSAEAESSTAKKPRAPRKSAAASKKGSAKRASKTAVSGKGAKAQTGKVPAAEEPPVKSKGGRRKTAGRVRAGKNDAGISRAAAEAEEQSA
jgi:DNA-binding protein H-NS